MLIIRVMVCRSSARPFLAGQQQRVVCGDVPGVVVVDEGDQVRVQWQVAAVVQFADRDVQPVPGADEHDRVGGQTGELADAQSGAQQHLADNTRQLPWLGLGGAQELRRSGIVEGLGPGFVLAGQIPGDDRHPGRGLRPAPFVEAEEEHPQRAEPVGEGVGGDPSAGAAWAAGQPGLVVLDVAALNAGHGLDLGRGVDQERGEAAQRQVGAADTARTQRAGQLLGGSGAS